MLLPSTLLLYGSGALYMASFASHITSVNRLVAQAQAGLFSEIFTTAQVDAFEDDVFKQSWMMTVSLTINVSRTSEPSAYSSLQAAIDVCAAHNRFRSVIASCGGAFARSGSTESCTASDPCSSP